MSNGEESDYIVDFEMLPEHLASISNDCLITALKSKLLNAQLTKDMLEGNPKGMKEGVLGIFAKRRRTIAKPCPYKASSSMHTLLAVKPEIHGLKEDCHRQNMSFE